MKTYKVYVSSGGQSEAVKQGWSWPAFFFGPIWALIKKLWLPGIGFLLLFIGLGSVEGYLQISRGKETAEQFNILTSLIGIGVSITFGLKGNRWRESNLESRRFRLQDTVNAESPDAALVQAVMRSRGESDAED